MLTLVWAPCAVLGLRSSPPPPMSLATCLWLDAPTLPPQRGLRQEIRRGDSANTTAEGVAVGLCRSAPTQNQARSGVKLTPADALR
jgi:hypothetical protein